MYEFVRTVLGIRTTTLRTAGPDIIYSVVYGCAAVCVCKPCN